MWIVDDSEEDAEVSAVVVAASSVCGAVSGCTFFGEGVDTGCTGTPKNSSFNTCVIEAASTEKISA